MNSDQVDWPKGITSQKRNVSKYWARHETRQEGLKPPEALFDTFMQEADLIASYKRVETEISKEISLIRSKFEEAFEDNDIEQMLVLYEDLEALRLEKYTEQN